VRGVTYSMGVSLDGYIVGPDASLDDAELKWAAIWKPLPKVVFSNTLAAVQGHARLASDGLAEEIERRVDLELVETRTFNSTVGYFRYRVVP
jgi:hypothetical protein